MATIFSRGNFYLGTDDEEFSYVHLHMWKFVIEWGRPTFQECGTTHDRSEDRESA